MLRHTGLRLPGAAVLAVVVAMCLAGPAAAQGDRGVSGMAGAADEVTGKRVALVVGNGAYTGAKPLRNPANDAKDVASALRACGFAVTVETDCDYERMDRAVEAFGNALRGASVSLFYYAGHGMQVQGENYLLPVDARLSAENEARLVVRYGG